MNCEQKTILVVGAGGFIGGFIAAEGLRRGYDTWVAVRASTSRRYLTDSRLHFLELDYDDPEAMEKAVEEALPAPTGWDFIIWNLGATKAANFLMFNQVNFNYPRTFVEMLRRRGWVPQKFLYMSSLSAVGPGDEVNYTPITSSTRPNPNTRYGLSKIKTETFLETLPDFPWVIFRPTGVYGPHEKDYLMMIKTIDSHWDVSMGFRRQLITFIYVDDLVEAMYQAIEAPNTVHRKYIISEDRAYTQKDFRQLVAKALGHKVVIPLKLPMWVVYIASVLCEKWAAVGGKPSTLNRDKFKIMRQRNWSCDISDAQRDFGFQPKFSLERGVQATVEAYLRDKKADKKK